MFKENGDIDAEYVKSAAALIRKLHLDGYRIAVSVGGGKFSAQYQDIVRKNGTQVMADKIGQMINHVNATLLISLLGEDVAYPKSITALAEGQLASKLNLIPVGAGFVEGATSDHSAVIIAERLGAKRLLNLSKIDGIYDADPSKNPKAKLIKKMSYEQLIELATRLDTREPKAPFVFDIVACKLAARSGIELIFANGKDLDSLKKLVEGSRDCGTIVG